MLLSAAAKGKKEHERYKFQRIVCITQRFFVHPVQDWEGMEMGRWRIRTWMMDNAYFVTLCCVLAMVVGCALYTRGLQQDVQAAAAAPEIDMTPLPTPAITPLPTIAALQPMALVQRGGTWPVTGGVLRAYDAQESVYWESLELFQTHMGMDIGGQTGEPVTACLDGVVTHAAWDALWGWRVWIAHDGNRETRYAGLESCLVQPGTRVQRGQVIGTLMERVPCEAEMGTHLHLESLREGVYQDPEAILEER